MGFQSGNIIIYDGKVLILNGTRDLHYWGSSMQELKCYIGRINTSRGQDGKPWKSIGNCRNSSQSHRPDSISGYSTISCLSFNGRPSLALAIEAHQTGNGIDCSYTIGTPFFGGASNNYDVGHIRRQFGKKRG